MLNLLNLKNESLDEVGSMKMNDYIKTMRRMIGHETLLTVGCGAIIEDSLGRILLQQRSESEKWGIPGGLLEIGETIEDTVKREVLEETNLTIDNLSLFGIYSGEKGLTKYPNGDKVFSIQVIFHITQYKGVLKSNHESLQTIFLHKQNMPSNLNAHQAPFINDWIDGVSLPIIK